jgi:hypothetical protein
MLPSLRITSSITSRLALAIIWMTCRSWPPPTRTPPLDVVCAVLEAPDKAVSVPANAEVDHDGRLDDNGDIVLAAGRDEKCVRLYNGVSDTDSIKK